jgi:hypothetical protein
MPGNDSKDALIVKKTPKNTPSLCKETRKCPKYYQIPRHFASLVRGQTVKLFHLKVKIAALKVEFWRKIRVFLNASVAIFCSRCVPSS